MSTHQEPSFVQLVRDTPQKSMWWPKTYWVLSLEEYFLIFLQYFGKERVLRPPTTDKRMTGGLEKGTKAICKAKTQGTKEARKKMPRLIIANASNQQEMAGVSG